MLGIIVSVYCDTERGIGGDPGDSSKRANITIGDLCGDSTIDVEKKTELLSAVELLESLSYEEAERLGRSIPEVHLVRDQILYTPAHRSEILFLLLRGRVLIYKMVEGREFAVNVVRAGEMFGEVALTSRRHQGAYAQALEPSEIARMSLNIFRRLVQDKPEVGLKAIELLGERLYFYESKMADMGLKGVPARLASLFVHLCKSDGIMTREGYKIPIRYTHQQLGTMIGAKRVAVNRALSKLVKAGVVELKRRYIYVKDAKTLKRAASR